MSPQLSLGKFPDGNKEIGIEYFLPIDKPNPTTFVLRIPTICDTFYYVLLCGYQTGLEALLIVSIFREHRNALHQSNLKTFMGLLIVFIVLVGSSIVLEATGRSSYAISGEAAKRKISPFLIQTRQPSQNQLVSCSNFREAPSPVM